MVESINVIEPTAWKLLLSAEMSMPVPQLLMLIPWYVKPQSHECLMAVTALLKIRIFFRELLVAEIGPRSCLRRT